MIDARAVDICQPDPAIAGGITETQRICALAAASGLTVAPHLWGSAILFAAGLHLTISTPCATMVEFSRGHNPLLSDLVEEQVELEDGYVLAPSRPGPRADAPARLREVDHGGGIASRRGPAERRYGGRGRGAGGSPWDTLPSQAFAMSLWGHEIGRLWLRRSAEAAGPGGALRPAGPPRPREVMLPPATACYTFLQVTLPCS